MKCLNAPRLVAVVVLCCLYLTAKLNAQISLTATAGTTTGSYTTLRSAFSAINAGTHKGVITIDVTANTTETLSATLVASNGSTVDYSSVLIRPSGGGNRTISGSINGNLLLFNGASNVTIDGLNSGGNSLTISNTNTGTSASTIAISNDASNNVITRCTILGSQLGAGNVGVITFTSTYTSTASDNNTISYCNIGPAGSNLPVYLVRSVGPTASGVYHGNNTITRCNLYDQFNATGNSFAIYLNNNCSSWNISHNKFYQTASRAFTGSSSKTHSSIYLYGSFGHTVEYNTLGYADSSSTGNSTFTNSGTSGITFYPIYIYSNTDSFTNTVANNTISNWDINANNVTLTFRAFYWEAAVNTIKFKADIHHNTIGSLTNANAIVLKTSGYITASGIATNNSGVTYFNYHANIYNNQIGSINSGTSTPSSFYFYGIYHIGNSTSIVNIYENTIGGATTNGAITTGNNNTVTGNYHIRGIQLNSFGNMSVYNNVVQQLYQTGTGTTYSSVIGITSSTSSSMNADHLIYTNVIRDLHSYSSYAGRTISGIDISASGANARVKVYDNEIYRIYNRSTVGESVAGISIPGNGPYEIYSNKIYDIEYITSNTTWASNLYSREGIFGIEMNNSTGSFTQKIYNNEIYLRGTSGACIPMIGIDLHSPSEVYHNSVVITGNGCSSGGTTVYTSCFNAGQYLEMPVKNNVFYNDRTGNGKHYSISNDGYTSYTSTNYTYFSDYNIYYTSNAATMARWGTSDRTFAQWKTSVGATLSGVDQNSYYENPLLASVGGTGSDFNLRAYSTNSVNNGDTIPTVTTDINGRTRAPFTPDRGAYENKTYVWEGNVNNQWELAVNWVGNEVPQDFDDVEMSLTAINELHLPSDKKVHDFTHNASINALLNGYALTISGEMVSTNTGGIVASSGTLKLISSETQMIPADFIASSGAIDQLIIRNTPGVTLNDITTINGTLTMLGGTLNPNNNLEMGDGANIIMTAGSIQSVPTFLGAVNVTYNGTSMQTTGPELPGNANVTNILTINNAAGVLLSDTAYVMNELYLNNGTFNNSSNPLYPENGCMIYRSSGSLSASPVFSTTVSVTYQGNSDITTGFELPTAPSVLSNLILDVNSANGVALGTSITVNSSLIFTSGRLSLGNHSLSMVNSASVSGASSANFVVTNGTGAFYWLNCAASQTKTFPVGHTNATSGYAPITLAFNPAHTTDHFSVVALNTVRSSGQRTGGNLIWHDAVNITWNISESTAGNTNVNITFQWNGTDELVDFNRGNCFMAHHDGTVWSAVNPGGLTASGSGPYTVTFNGYTGSFSPFSLGSGMFSPLPVSILNIDGRKHQDAHLISWVTSNESNLSHYMVERSFDLHTFEPVGTVSAINAMQTHNYEIIDAHREAYVKGAYYKLTSIDLNGQQQSYKVIYIGPQTSATITAVYPVPAVHTLNIQLGENHAATGYQITDMSGRIVYASSLSAESQQIAINVTGFTRGTYFLTVFTPQGNTTEKVLIN